MHDPWFRGPEKCAGLKSVQDWKVCRIEKLLSYLPQIQGQGVSIASFDCWFYCIVARVVAVWVGQDDVLGRGKYRKSSFSWTHFRSQNEILQNCIDGSSGILQRKKINFLHVGLFIRQTCTKTRFFGSAPTKLATSATAESYRGRTVERNHLDIRDARWCF